MDNEHMSETPTNEVEAQQTKEAMSQTQSFEPAQEEMQGQEIGELEQRLMALEHEKIAQGIVEYCKSKDPSFDLALAKKVFDEKAAADPYIAMRYGGRPEDSYEFWEKFVKPQIHTNRKAQVPPRYEELLARHQGEGLDIEEMTELLKMIDIYKK